MEVGGLYQFVLALVLIGLVVGVGLVVLSEFGTSLKPNTAGCNSTAVTQCDTAYNATQSTITALSTIPSTWMGLLVTIVVVAIILGLVIRSFSGGQAR